MTASVDSYIAALPPDVASIMERLRKTIRHAAPGTVETIKYDMPLFSFGGAYLYVAAWKKHIGLYPIHPAPAALETEIAPYRAKKDTLQFLYRNAVPYDLVAKIVAIKLEQALSTR